MPPTLDPPLSPRAFWQVLQTSAWEEIWEAGPYYDRIAALMEEAAQFVVFAGWQIDSRLPMPIPPEQFAGRASERLDDATDQAPPAPAAPRRETLKQKMIRLCEAKPDLHIYLLMWDHAYFYVAEREVWQGRIWEDIHPRVHFVFDNCHPFGGSHHEKLALFDGRIALCGGIDLCDDRWDSPQHLYHDPRRSLDGQRERHGPYHDLAVQVDGPVAREIHRHLQHRWQAISGLPFPPAAAAPEPAAPMKAPMKAPGHRVYVSRTISEAQLAKSEAHAAASDDTLVREIEFLFLELIDRAQHQLLLEGQYYWSDRLNEALIAKMFRMAAQSASRPAPSPFRVVIVLSEIQRLKSLTRQMALHELRLLQRLEQAAQQTGTVLIMGAPYVMADHAEASARPIYVHSKIMLVDDRYCSIGSANFAARALRVDTEINLTLEAVTEAERARLRRVADSVLRHWNLVPASGREHIELRRFRPTFELRAVPALQQLARRIPWAKFMDPELPFMYLIKRRYSVRTRRHPTLRIVSLAGLWGLATALSAAVASALAHSEVAPAGAAIVVDRGWALAYLGLLSGAWLVPIPYLLVSLLAVAQLGRMAAMPIVIAAYWIASLVGYVLVRTFPGFSRAFYPSTSARWVARELGLRRFDALLRVLFNPRARLREKIAYQGLFCVPAPWFLLTNGLILPGGLYGVCALASLLGSHVLCILHLASPGGSGTWGRWIEPDGLRQLEIVAFAAVGLGSLSSIFWRLWKRRR